MKKIFFFALLSAFTLITTSCNKDDATEIVDKTEYKVIFLTYISSTSSSGEPVNGVKITLLDYDKTCTTSEGKAELNLPQGEYRITVEKSGHDYYGKTTFGDEEFTTFSVYGNTVKTINLYKKNS